jgi:methanogenic corrinoid protein MtbC1
VVYDVFKNHNYEIIIIFIQGVLKMTRMAEEFISILETEDRAKALEYIIGKLESGEAGIVEIYEEVLARSLNEMKLTGEEKTDIWKEHVRSSIIKTIVENCYPYVVKERGSRGSQPDCKKVAVVCPVDEYHEIGARMIADYFTINGYDTTFVGSNTPKEVFISGIHVDRPDYVAISITNPYNLVSARNTIELIRKSDPNVMILAGGSALSKLNDRASSLGADRYLTSFEDIEALKGGSGI